MRTVRFRSGQPFSSTEPVAILPASLPSVAPGTAAEAAIQTAKLGTPWRMRRTTAGTGGRWAQRAHPALVPLDLDDE